jgi:MscS family membrane protein
MQFNLLIWRNDTMNLNTNTCVRLLICCAMLLFASDFAHAEDAAKPTDQPNSQIVGYRSPDSVLSHFQRYVRDGDLDGAMRAMDLTSIAPGVRDEIGQRSALKLALVLERLPAVEVPKDLDADVFILATTKHGDVTLRRHIGIGNEKLWQFSSSTIQSLTPIFRELIQQAPLAQSLAMNDGGAPLDPFQWSAPEIAVWLNMPPGLKREVFGLEMYQWIGFPLVALISWLIALLIQVPVKLFLNRLAQGGTDIRTGRVDWQHLISNTTHAVSWTVALQAANWLVLLLGLPIEALGTVLVCLQVANVIVITRLGFALIDYAGTWLSTHDKAAADSRAMDELLIASGVRLSKLLALIIMSVWVVMILGAEGSVDRMLAGLGIGGIAFALALQEPLKNFFSSLVLAADRPFGVGDTLKFEGLEGKVERVGFRTTTMRTKLQTSLIIPNATLVSAKLESHSGNALKVFKASLPIAFEADAASMDQLRVRARQILEQAPGVQIPSIEVGVVNLSSNGIEFCVTACFAKGEISLAKVFDGLHVAILATAQELHLPLVRAT